MIKQLLDDKLKNVFSVLVSELDSYFVEPDNKEFLKDIINNALYDLDVDAEAYISYDGFLIL